MKLVQAIGNEKLICDYLKRNYYPRYCPEKMPKDHELVNALIYYRANIMVGMIDEKICGVSIYLTLDDKTYEGLEHQDLKKVEVVAQLMEQTGRHMHFILVCCDEPNSLWFGYHQAKTLGFKTISWWNPAMTTLHRKRLTQEMVCHR